MKRYLTASCIESANNAGGVTLELEYYPYERYGKSALKRVKVKGDDLLHALTKMVDKMCLYLDSEQIEEAQMTPKDILDELDMTNGDGCDYIMYIKDLSTGEILLQGDYEGDEDVEEEW